MNISETNETNQFYITPTIAKEALDIEDRATELRESIKMYNSKQKGAQTNLHPVFNKILGGF